VIRRPRSLRLGLPVLVLTLLTASATCWAGGSDAAASFDCPALYDSGEYLQAANCFASLEAAGNHNGHLLYNLGNSWQQAGKTGKAILAYRRAQLYLPRNADLLENLKAARNKVRDDLPPPDERGPVARTILAPYDSLSSAELLVLGTVAWALLFGFLTLRAGRNEALVSLPATLLALAAVAGLGGHLARSYQVSSHPIAVIQEEEVTLRSGRNLRSVELARLHEGSELHVVEEADDWTQVALSSGQRGWLPGDSLGLARFVAPEQDR